MTVTDLKKEEYGEFYQTYIDICGNFELVKGLRLNHDKTQSLLKSIPLNKQEYRYEVGKWTIKELVQHLIDSERIFTYRALRFSRNDMEELPGYDHNNYVPESKANNRDYNELLSEFNFVRQSTISLFNSFDDIILKRKGVANNSAMSVRALGFIIVGHCNHHCRIIEERYID